MVFTTEQEMQAKLRELQSELVNAKKIIAVQGKALQDSTAKDLNTNKLQALTEENKYLKKQLSSTAAQA